MQQQCALEDAIVAWRDEQLGAGSQNSLGARICTNHFVERRAVAAGYRQPGVSCAGNMDLQQQKARVPPVVTLMQQPSCMSWGHTGYLGGETGLDQQAQHTLHDKPVESLGNWDRSMFCSLPLEVLNGSLKQGEQRRARIVNLRRLQGCLMVERPLLVKCTEHVHSYARHYFQANSFPAGTPPALDLEVREP